MRALPALVDVFARGARCVVVVLGGSSASRPWRRSIVDALGGVLVDVCEHDGKHATSHSVDRIVDVARSQRARVLVAVGGGSVLDACKVARVRLSAGVRLVAVPTTPGTGAEVTPFAAVWDFERGRKRSISDRGVAPDAAIVDPELSASLPTPDLGSSLLDALVQGVEAAWSNVSTEESTARGLAAASLAVHAYETAVTQPSEVGARTSAALAGLESGLAIRVSQTTVCHAVSYPLTLRHGVRHGHACSMTLPHLLAYNGKVEGADCADSRGVERVRSVLERALAALGARSPHEVDRLLRRFRAVAGLDELEDYDVELSGLAEEAMSYDRARNNPRRLDADTLAGALSQRFDKAVAH